MRLFLLLLTIGCASFSHAQALLSYQDAVKLALQNNYDILLAENDAKQAVNNNSAGNAGMLPTIDAGASVGGTNNDINQRFVDGRIINRNGVQATTTTAGVGLGWTLFDGTNMFINRQRLKQLQEVGAINFRLTVENTVYAVSDLYYQMVRLQYLIRVSDNNLKVSADRLQLAENRYKGGLGSKLDYIQTKVDFNADRSSLMRSQYQLDTLKMQFNMILARDPLITFNLSDSIVTDSSLQFGRLKSELQNKNTSLALSTANTRIAELDVRSIQARRAPRIDLGLGYNYVNSRSQAGLLLQNRTYGLTYGLNATVPLFNGFNLRREYQNAKLSRNSSELQYRKQELLLNTRLNSAYLRYNRNLELLKIESENVESARQAVEIALEKYRIGSSTLLEVKNAQQSLMLIENNFISVQYEVKKAELDMLRLSGGLITTAP